MYQFRSVTDHIEDLHQRIRNRLIIMDSERATLQAEAYKKNEHMIPPLKRAWTTKYICENVSYPVYDFENIVGSTGKNFCGTGVDPIWKGIGWLPNDIRKGKFDLKEDGMYHNRNTQEVLIAMPKEDYEALIAMEDFWEENRLAAIATTWRPDGFDQFAATEATVYKPNDKVIEAAAGHIIAGYKKILNTGYGAIRKQAQDWLDAHKGNMRGKEFKQAIFYQSAIWACDAGSALCKGYAGECRKQAEEKPSPRKEKLLEIADSLEWISENPVRTFKEACQAVVMMQILLNIEASHPGLAIGRFDQYTWPFLKKDLEEGRLTEDEAQEVCDEFFLKLNCFYKGGATGIAQITGIGNTWQHTTIGGVDPKTGEDATNPVTYMVLETLGRLQLHDPTISLRINKNTPQKLWECAIATSKKVGGLPLYQNDDVIIPAVQREMGFSLEDARDIGFIGCQEIVGSGNEYPACTGPATNKEKVHWGVALTMALNNGVNPFNGADSGIRTGYLYEMKSIDDVKSALEKIVTYLFNWVATMNNMAEYIAMRYVPHAALSITLDGCMEKGMDAVEGGAKYNSFGSCACGLATIADSLSAIEYLCFDKKKCTTKELYDAVMANWEGYESLRALSKKEVPHFGNNDEYADKYMNWVTTLYRGLCDGWTTERATLYRAGMFSAADHVMQGYHTWATPDGRKSGEAIADAASPSQGADKNGPTSIFMSSVAYDQSRFMNSLALNLRFTPTALKTDSDIEKLIAMIKTYFNAGGMEVQFNIVDTKTLYDAMEKPENYTNLVVRIAGYSAYFIQMTKDMQKDIIARNENTL
ncbi:MAG: hypothetical protein MJ150_04115 [Clostridia bacterium]|nr:hypothetical protein [Clostridia bacterium]